MLRPRLDSLTIVARKGGFLSPSSLILLLATSLSFGIGAISVFWNLCRSGQSRDERRNAPTKLRSMGDSNHSPRWSCSGIMKMKFIFKFAVMKISLIRVRPTGRCFPFQITALILCVFALFLASRSSFAAASGSLSGTLSDPSGAVITGASVTLINTPNGSKYTAVSNDQGFFSFPSLPVGHYDVTIEAPGFKTQKKSDLIIDTNAALKLEATLKVGDHSEQVNVEGDSEAIEVQVDTVATNLGEVVSGREIVGVALNGRSYTDLLALQPGIVPMSTQTPDSVVMAGATVAINPSGALNPGNQSIVGQREDANGFLVNGGDVKELMNGGTLIIPDLDSISEFRILTDNYDAEYGNYSGGIISVVTKSGTNQLHGSAFEFLRNTELDAKNFFSIGGVEPYRQNQFGGTLGGPIRKDRLFFFTDYQGTRTTEGLSTGLISVPTLADRSGSLSDEAGLFETGCNGPCLVSPCNVVGTCLATELSNSLSSAVGTPVAVSPGEPFYTAGCATYAQCVFPNATFPLSAWSAPAQHLLQYIPQPNVGTATFSTGSQAETVRDDKLSFRLDGRNTGWGQFTAYYFYDNYRVNDPYPTEQGGSSSLVSAR